MLLSLLLVNANAASDIQTYVIDKTNQYSDGMLGFPAMPCYILGAKDHPEGYAKAVKIFKDAGFIIVDSDSAACRIVLIGIVKNVASSGGEKFYPEEVLDGERQWPSEDVMVNPQIAEKIKSAKNQTASNNAGPTVGGNGINIMTQAGGAIGGQSAALGFGLIGGLLNILGSINLQDPTPEGVVDVSGEITFGGFFNHTRILSRVFAASSKPEKAEALYYAGLRTVAVSLRQHILNCHITAKLPLDMGTIHYHDGHLTDGPPVILGAGAGAGADVATTAAKPDQANAGSAGTDQAVGK